MTILIATLALWLLGTVGAPTQRSDPPQFRSGATRVSVNVTVRAGNVPVAGLSRADFEIVDNGVVQVVDSISMEEVPIDATFIVDTSGSLLAVLDELRRDTRDIAAVLRPVDRLRIISIDTYVHEVLPMQSPSGELRLRQTPVGGTSSVYDAIAAALMAKEAVGRRQVIVVMTDAVDTLSALDAHGVRDLAARSDAVLHVLLVAGDAVSTAHRPWMAYKDLDLGTIGEAARSTGGELHKPGLFRSRRVAQFAGILSEFRLGYLLHYTPTGVSPSGWHQLTVRLLRAGSYDIRARKGYFGM